MLWGERTDPWGTKLSWSRFWVIRVPWASQSHQIPMVVDMVSPEDHVNGCMQLDGGNLSAAQLHHVVDMMNVVILNNAEHTAHTPHDSGLLTMMDVAAPNDMAAYFFFEPSMILPTADSIPLHLCRAFHMLIGKIVVVCLIVIFAKGNAAAPAVADLAVLDDPAL